VAEGLMARSGAARGDEKPTGQVATDEPMAEWERDLLVTADVTADATTGAESAATPAPVEAAAPAEAAAPVEPPADQA
jgi:small subunit ribosomal protein S2